MAPIQTSTPDQVAIVTFADEALSTVTIEELNEVDGGVAASGTHNCGGTFGTATCPASIGTAFSFT